MAILSESKYGFACQGNVLRISLLRAATAPDAEQDQGMHSHLYRLSIDPDENKRQASTSSLGLSYLIKVLSWSPTCQWLLTSSTLRYTVCSCHSMRGVCSDMALVLSPSTVRTLNANAESHEMITSSPFIVSGAPNVFLETVKRGENDSFDVDASGSTTVILRLYEAFGGHAQARLRIGGHLRVTDAFVTNLLEDEDDSIALNIMPDDASGNLVKLDFRGFEVKTVKLVLQQVKEDRTRQKEYVNVTHSLLQ